jgi:hypothetical protein
MGFISSRFTQIDWVRKAVRKAIRAVVVSLALACLINVAGGIITLTIEPSYAMPASAQVEDREQAYEQAKAVAEDPKMGVEKEYEKEIEAYQQEHSGEGGLLDKAKELAAEAAGTAHK